MPQLLVRGITPEQMCRISSPLVNELAAICECGTDNFIIEVVHTSAVQNGELVASFPFVEVAWFERGPAIRSRFAMAITTHVQSLGISEIEIAFIVYRKDSYYINGEPCSR